MNWTPADLAAKGLRISRDPLERTSVAAPSAACKGPMQARREGSAAHVLPATLPAKLAHPGLPMLVEFTVPGDVRGWARQKPIGYGSSVPDTKSQRYKRVIEKAARSSMRDAQLVRGPVRLLITAYIAVPASYSRRKREDCLTCRVWPTVKPDFDNIEKVVADALTGVVWLDDKQVVQSAFNKLWAVRGSLHVMVDAVFPVGDQLAVVA
jgi:Holliday junction resolvase RusA-like endonuclease